MPHLLWSSPVPYWFFLVFSAMSFSYNWHPHANIHSFDFKFFQTLCLCGITHSGGYEHKGCLGDSEQYQWFPSFYRTCKGVSTCQKQSSVTLTYVVTCTRKLGVSYDPASPFIPHNQCSSDLCFPKSMFSNFLCLSNNLDLVLLSLVNNLVPGCPDFRPVLQFSWRANLIKSLPIKSFWWH